MFVQFEKYTPVGKCVCLYILIDVCRDNKVLDLELFICFEQLNHVPGIFCSDVTRPCEDLGGR